MSRKMMVGAASATSGSGISGVNTLHLNDGVTDQRAEVADSATLDVTNITASVYFLVRSFSGTMTVFSKYQDGVERSWSMDIDPISRKLVTTIYSDSTAYTVTQTGILVIDTWYQGAFTFDGTDLNLYVNASLLNTIEVPGADVVIDGDFPDNTNWIEQTNWSIGSGVAVSTGASIADGARDLYQVGILEVGATYELTVEIIAYTSGSLRVWTGSQELFIGNSTGTKVVTLPSNHTDLIFTTGASDNFIGSIDNVSAIRSIAFLDTSAADVRIGARGDTLNEQPFIGDTALPIMYSADILQAGITELLEPKDPSLYTQTNMVLGIPGNAGSSTPETDTSGNANNATLINSPDYIGVKLAIEQSEALPTEDYNSFPFNVNADKITVPVVPANNLQGDYTWACWIYASTNVTHYMLYAHDGAVSFRGAYMSWSSLKAEATVFPTPGSNGGVVTVISTASLAFNQWHLCIARLDTTAQTLSMTLNGATNSVPCTVTQGDSSAYDWAIGHRAGVPDSNLTMPMIFDRVLTDGECDIILNSGNPAYFETLPSSITDDCVGAWELSSRDNSAVDLTGTSNGTKQNGVTSDGQLVTYSSVP